MFISTMNTPESFIKNGYPIYSEKKYHKIIDESNLLNLKFLINNASVVIIGAASDEYIKHRISNNKLTFGILNICSKSMLSKFLTLEE